MKQAENAVFSAAINPHNAQNIVRVIRKKIVTVIWKMNKTY